MAKSTAASDLVTVLDSLGVEGVKPGRREISARCPVHEQTVGHADTHPSWSMNRETGLWICYSCGAKGSLSKLVSLLTGDDDTILTVNRHLISAGIKQLRERFEPDEEETEPEPEIDWRAFARFEPVPQRQLDRRHLTARAAAKYGLRWDRAERCWIIPILTPLGELMGWQRKATGYFKNEPYSMRKSTTLFGIQEVEHVTGVLVESPLDVARLYTVMDGVSGVASMGVYVSDEQIRLLGELFDRLIVALDDDREGRRATKGLGRRLPMFRQHVVYLNYKECDGRKDIGEMTADEIERTIDTASLLPWWVL
jgi:DNA primase